MPVRISVRSLLRTHPSVLALGTVGGRAVLGRLNPRSVGVLAKAYLPEVEHEGQGADSRGRVLVAVRGAHPRLIVLRERDLEVTGQIALPQQLSGAPTSPPVKGHEFLPSGGRGTCPVTVTCSAR